MGPECKITWDIVDDIPKTPSGKVRVYIVIDVEITMNATLFRIANNIFCALYTSE